MKRMGWETCVSIRLLSGYLWILFCNAMFHSKSYAWLEQANFTGSSSVLPGTLRNMFIMWLLRMSVYAISNWIVSSSVIFHTCFYTLYVSPGLTNITLHKMILQDCSGSEKFLLCNDITVIVSLWSIHY